MDARLDLDYCPACDLPTFNHERVALIAGAFVHTHCITGTIMVAKMSALVTSRPTE